jgi:hypothetical protein
MRENSSRGGRTKKIYTYQWPTIWKFLIVFCEVFGWLGFGTMVYSYFSPQFAEEFKSELLLYSIGISILLILLILLYLTRGYALKEDKLALKFLWIPYFKP